jgi:hypothetical protein
VHLNIELLEFPEIIIARFLNQENIRSEIIIVPGSPHHPILTFCFSTFSQSGTSELYRQTGKQTGLQTDRQTDRQTGRQAGRQASRQANRTGT